MFPLLAGGKGSGKPAAGGATHSQAAR
jgi:hypothetical protein